MLLNKKNIFVPNDDGTYFHGNDLKLWGFKSTLKGKKSQTVEKQICE